MRTGLRSALVAEGTKFLVVIVAALAVHWLGTTSERMLEHAISHGWEGNGGKDLLLLAIPGVVLLALWRLWRYSRRHAGVVVGSAGEARFCRQLVFFLSPPTTPRAAEAGDGLAEAIRRNEVGLPEPGSCHPMLANSPWRMPLEAIAHHARLGRARGESIERIHLIASNQTWDFAELFRLLVENALGRKGVLEIHPRALSFDDFQEVSEAVNRVFERIEEEGDRPFLMDMTGGSKICSVVAAALSFEQGRRIQYVHSNGLLVGEYDLQYLGPEHLKPGA